MTDIGIPPRSKQDWDVPVARLEADVKALVARQRAHEVLEAALAKATGESDRIVYAGDLFLIAHPEACSCAADYPDWSAAMDARIATEQRTRGGAS